jgi:hypothetical protein
LEIAKCAQTWKVRSRFKAVAIPCNSEWRANSWRQQDQW